MLAKNTGWTEAQIVNLPYYRILQYLHAFLVYNGQATRWAAVDQAKKEHIKNKLKNLLDER